MRHNLKVRVSERDSSSLVRCKKISIREKVLTYLLGESRKITVIIPGDTVSGLSIAEVDEDKEPQEINVGHSKSR